MLKKLLLAIFIFNFFSNNAQTLQKVLGKAYLAKTQDSSDYYFQKAKKLIKTDAEEGEFLFCKSARQGDYGSRDSAIFYGKKAIIVLEKAKSINSLLTVYNNLGNYYNDRGEYDKAISNRIEALKIAEENDRINFSGYLYRNISYDYHDFENYEKGVYYGKKAFQIYKSDKNSKPVDFQGALNAIAINYDDWNKPELALYYHKLNFKFVKGKDTLILQNTYNNIGNTLLKQKKYLEAKKWILRSKKIIDYRNKKRDLINFDYNYATCYTNLATIASELNQFDEAKKYFDLAFLYAKKSKTAEKLRDYYFQKSIYNKKRNNLSETIKEQDNYIKLRDSIYTIERDKALAEMEAKYQTEKKEKELLLTKNSLIQKEAETKRKNLWLLIACLIAGFVGLIGYLFVRQQKTRNNQQKQEFELRTAMTKIESQNELQEQRLSISRDLHDNIGSQLTFIISSVENLKFGIADTNPKAETKLAQISDFTKSTIIELRDTIWAMNNNDIVFDDLRVRILNFLGNAKIAQEKTDFDFYIDERLKEVKLTSLVWVNIYRTAQEAINNAIKYANATKIAIAVNEVEDKIQIQIKDNGKGFNIAEVNRGNGLFNMEKRIAEIGGDFSLQSEINQGTTILISIKK